MDARSLAVAVWLAASLAAAARAEPPACEAPRVLPAGAIPRNAGGFRVVAGYFASDPEVVVRRAGDAEPLPAHYAGPELVRIDAELAAGDELAIALTDDCLARERPVTATLSVTPDAPRPAALGAIVLGPAREGEVPLPPPIGCELDEAEPVLGVYRLVELAPDPSARAWLPLLPIVARVDAEGAAERLEGDDPAAPGRFLVYARCDGGEGGLAEGEHEVRLEARAEALGLGLATPAARVPLRCTESVLARVREERAAEARRALLRDAERAAGRYGPQSLGVVALLGGALLVRRRLRRRSPWPPDDGR